MKYFFVQRPQGRLVIPELIVSDIFTVFYVGKGIYSPGLDSVSRSFGTKIVNIGFMYADIKRGVLTIKWSSILALCSLFRLMPECWISVSNCTRVFRKLGITKAGFFADSRPIVRIASSRISNISSCSVISNALSALGCASWLSKVSSSERSTRSRTLASTSVIPTVSSWLSPWLTIGNVDESSSFWMVSFSNRLHVWTVSKRISCWSCCKR